jgi:hypothetical protein
MTKIRLDRRGFWIAVAIYFALKIAMAVAVVSGSFPLKTLGSIDNILLVGLAFAVGSRFMDFGSRLWLGYLCTFLVTFVLQLALFAGEAAIFGIPKASPNDPLSIIPASVGLISLAALATFLIWAGTRPSVAAKS